MNILIKFDNYLLFDLIKDYFYIKYNYFLYFKKYKNINYDLIISINNKDDEINDKIIINCCKIIFKESEYFKLLLGDLLNNRFFSKRYRINSFLFFTDFITGLDFIIKKGKVGKSYNLYPSKKEQINDKDFLILLQERIKLILNKDVNFKIKSKISKVTKKKNNIEMIKLGWKQSYSLKILIDNFLRKYFIINPNYDLVFSVVTNKKAIHILNFISNVIKFNEKNNILIVLHLDEKNYNIKNIYESSYVLVNNIYYDKIKGTQLEFIPIIDNFNFLEELKVKYNNYIYLSSNSRFIKQNKKITKNSFEYKFIKTKQNIKSLKKWHWNRFKKNKEILEIFRKSEIELTGFNLSGVIFDYNLIKDIIFFIENFKILEKIKDGYGMIEILIPSLSKYYLGFKLNSILKIFFKTYS